MLLTRDGVKILKTLFTYLQHYCVCLFAMTTDFSLRLQVWSFRTTIIIFNFQRRWTAYCTNSHMKNHKQQKRPLIVLPTDCCLKCPIISRDFSSKPLRLASVKKCFYISHNVHLKHSHLNVWARTHKST